MIENQLKNLHTAFLAKIISSNGGRATVQPLQRDTSIIPNVLISQSARYKISVSTESTPVLTPIRSGDIVVCVCCEQNISTSRKGKIPSNSEPEQRFSLSNAIIVGII